MANRRAGSDRAALGEAGFEADWAEGRAMPLELAIELALNEALDA